MLKNKSLSKWLFPVKGEVNSILLPHSLLKASVPSLPIFLTLYQIDGLNISDKTVLGTQRCGCSCAFVWGRVSLCVPRAVCTLWREKFTFCRKCKSDLQAWGGCTYRQTSTATRACERRAKRGTALRGVTQVFGQILLRGAILPGLTHLGKPFLPEDTRVQGSVPAELRVPSKGEKDFPSAPLVSLVNR